MLVDEYNSTYYYSIGKKFIYANYFTLSEEFESSHKAPKVKVSHKVRITRKKNIFTPKIGQVKYLLLVL